ncbi:MAG: hypothetical protein EOL88_08380 [Bacteroidia bacterium]|nr:hypothetical protein [Bacteroidia bacterium]
MKSTGLLFTLFLLIQLLPFQAVSSSQNQVPDSLSLKMPVEIWVDSVIQTLSTEEKIAQLIFIRTYSNKDEKYEKEIDRIIRRHRIGGLCFFQGGPRRQAILTNHWQSESKIPLLIALDAEWGPGMRLDSTLSYPKQMTLGAISNDSLIYRMGGDIALQLANLGTHINFAPVADINSNPANPVINTRSFGEDRENVARKSIMYMQGLQDHGIIATAKHFPGHGDTDTDSHLTLPVLPHTKCRMDSLELYPFKKLIAAGLGGIMTAHLYIPLYEKEKNRASTLSYPVVTTLLSDSLGFHGLKVTDALDMSGVTRHFKPGDIELQAFLAGNDILLLSSDAQEAIKTIKNAVRDGLIAEEMLNDRCKKVLTAKYNSGLSTYTPVNTGEVATTEDQNQYEPLRRELYRESFTLLSNQDNLLPLTALKAGKSALITFSDNSSPTLKVMLDNYFPTDTFILPLHITAIDTDVLLQNLQPYNTIIVALHTQGNYKNKYGITKELRTLITQIDCRHKTVMVYIGNPYGIQHLSPTLPEAFLVVYEENETALSLAAQSLCGAYPIRGRLPVSSGPTLKPGCGIDTKAINVLQYGIPEERGIKRKAFDPIDSLIHKAIQDKAFPGCQLLVAKDGRVVVNKAYGFPTYNHKKNGQVSANHLYDLASITKVAATTLAVMKLSDLNKIDIDRRLSDYLPDLRDGNKKDLIIREIMAHQGGLQPWIPYFIPTLDAQGHPKEPYYTKQPDPQHCIMLSDTLFLCTHFPLQIYDTIRTSPLRKTSDYKYSDLGFILIHRALEQITNSPLEQFVDQYFYQPLGLHRITFHPALKFPMKLLIPTEQEKNFRRKLIHGTVHDPAAAMLGGVSGHAGLFSNAHDLAVLMQMLLQKGNYAGIQFLDSTTVKEFTACQFPLDQNRRGIGFDKPLLSYYDDGPVCKSASPDSFGHSGFTGTYFWADPENNLIYVFLSNRIHPGAKNNLILKENLRTNIHQMLYEIFF